MQHLDEGTVHAWLDGQLPPAEAAATATHVEGCAECSALVAEARGFIAASSRIVGALDDVPGGVIPSNVDELARKRAERSGAAGRPRTRTWWKHPGFAAAAALVVVAIGSYRVLTRVSAAEALRDVEPKPASVARSDSVAAVAAEAIPVNPPATRSADRPAPRVAAAPAPGTTAPLDRVTTAAADSPSFRRVAPESGRLQEAKTTNAVAGVPAPQPATLDAQAKERAEVAKRSVAGAAQALGASAGLRDDARNALAAKSESTARVAPACYTLERVAVGGGPMAIAAPRLPARIQLDTTVAATEVNPPQYSARDISPVDRDSTVVLRWRVAAGGFDLFVERRGTTTWVAVMLVNDEALARRRATPQPAGASVLVRATAVPCTNR